MSGVGLMMKMMSFGGKSIIRSLEKMTKDPLKYQEEILFSILEENKDTEFGRENGFADIRSVEEYRKRLPMREYDDYAPYIERMVKGEENVLVKEHISHYNKTSGTLGLAKYIPLSQKQVSICGKYHALHANAVISSQIGYSWNDGKGINLTEGRAVVLESGATYGAASSVVVKGGPMKDLSSQLYTSPVEARQPEAGVITRYIHARFALAERNVTYITATFSSIIMEMFKYIEHNHEMLVNDIEKGTIDETVGLPEDVRKSLLDKIKPDPVRAAELREAFLQGFDLPWAKRIWKKLQYMYCVGGANFAPYTHKLKEHILGDEVKIFYMGVSASEGFFSTIYKMGESTSLLAPDGCFMEFLDTDDENAQCITMDKLEEGKSYELVITSFGGLYRYRMHDVVTVTGYHNKTPLIEFRNRAGWAANIRGEKTSEAAVRHAVEETERKLELDVVDFSIYPDPDQIPPAYVMFMELNKRPDGIEREKIRQCLQEELINANRSLEKHFGEGGLGPIKLILLQRETYMLYRDVMIMKGASASQLKPVNVIRNEFQRKFFFKLDEENE
ncbi:MAG: GH3 auxin-responsive promoter family protein [Lachnospiraceae bacterium]|nr:GH3 auxin-responsive promoter family protein [Lachnospiraceae bacterium]